MSKIATEFQDLFDFSMIHISDEMNKITHQNVHNWYKNLEIKTYIRDFENTYFGQIFSYNKSINDKEFSLISFVSSTLNN